MTSIFSTHLNWNFPYHTTLDDLAKVIHDYCLTKSKPPPLSNMWHRWKLISTHSQQIHTDLNAGDTEVKKKKTNKYFPYDICTLMESKKKISYREISTICAVLATDESKEEI